MRLALFDLDDTLLDGDCSALWNDWMVERGWIADSGEYLARTQAMNMAYHAGRLRLLASPGCAGRQGAGHRAGELPWSRN